MVVGGGGDNIAHPSPKSFHVVSVKGHPHTPGSCGLWVVVIVTAKVPVRKWPSVCLYSSSLIGGVWCYVGRANPGESESSWLGNQDFVWRLM